MRSPLSDRVRISCDYGEDGNPDADEDSFPRHSGRTVLPGKIVPASVISRAAILVFLQCCSVAAWPAVDTLTSDVAEAKAGYFRLSWTADEPVRLVESRTATFDDFRTIYAGADTARIMSGKPNGDWFYRLESIGSGAVVAGPVRVEVRHHSLQRAFTFFALGATVFSATLALIIFGSRADRA